MTRRHVAIWIRLHARDRLIRPSRSSPRRRVGGHQTIRTGGPLRSGTLASFVVEFAARADLSAAASIEGGRSGTRRVPRPHDHGRAVAVGCNGVNPRHAWADADTFWLTNVLVVSPAPRRRSHRVSPGSLRDPLPGGEGPSLSSNRSNGTPR